MAKLKGVPRPEKPVRVKHLLKVEGDANNNKYYDMYDTGDGKFIAFYGRVGADPQIEEYPISKWDSKYKEKLSARKGYKDITHLRVETSSGQSFVDIADVSVANFVAELQRYANNLIQQTYLVTARTVTLAQIAEAQRVLDQLLMFINDPGYSKLVEDKYLTEVNDVLIKLFTVIPRKMKNVKDHLIHQKDETILRQIITDEQDNLDTMEGQVKAFQLQQQNTANNVTLLDAMGLQISTVDNGIIPHIRNLLGENAKQFHRAFRIVNVKTQERFDKHLATCKNKTVMELWHGSRNQNWWSIMGSGLVLHPTSAVITGKMFGYGLYFADKARKSIGYTSLSGSYWARGGDSKAFLALFDVHVGNQWHVRRHSYEMNTLTWDKLRQKGDFDSLFAEGGYDLYNNEFIVYREPQATIKYLVEIGH